MKSDLITKDIVVKGHNDLILRVGGKYDIHYGIHQGIHEYVGTTMDGEHLFKNIERNEVTFSFHSEYSPFEFTRIVTDLN